MHRATDFSTVVRSGSRARHGSLVVHQRRGIRQPASDPLVGLIVSRAVGGSVVRHRVSRRLRAQLTERAHLLPPASGTVVRALPAAGSATSVRLGRDLDRALAGLTRSR
jgi:ribonuclease P protein component